MQNKKYHLKRLKNELLSQSLKSDSDNTYGYTEIVTAAVNDEDTFSNFRVLPKFTTMSLTEISSSQTCVS